MDVNKKAYVLAEFLLTMVLFYTESLQHSSAYLALAALYLSCQNKDIDNYTYIKQLLSGKL